MRARLSGSGSLMRLFAIFLLLSLANMASAEPCNQRNDLVGKCFVVHGRLSYKNGGAAMLLWPIGSKLLLGAFGELPSNIADHMLEFDDMTFADFEVCPLAKQEPGIMQFVCINRASNPIFQYRDSSK